MSEVRIIIAGGRDFDGVDNYSILSDTLSAYIEEGLECVDHRNIVIMSGGARGADKLGEAFAYNYDLRCRRFPAYWDQYGRAAGPIRNRKMAKYAAEETGVLFAFWDGKSRGTKNMIDWAKSYGLEIHVVRYEN